MNAKITCAFRSPGLFHESDSDLWIILKISFLYRVKVALDIPAFYSSMRNIKKEHKKSN